MLFFRRRYYFWLAQAYLKRWYKTILASIIIGIVMFSLSILYASNFLLPHFEKKIQKIGYSGAYTVNNLPSKVLFDLSFGLTKVSDIGGIKDGAAHRWEVKNNSKTYIFFLKKGYFFHDGQELTSDNLPMNFKDVEKRAIDKYTVEYSLKNSYSPFLASASKPIFGKNFSGLGPYKLKKIDVNAGFVKSITIESIYDKQIKKMIFFYPTQRALKTAFLLGEVDTADGINDIIIDNKNLSDWKNIKSKKYTNYSELITLFYNNNDKMLSNKKLRQSLNYALPQKFKYGERAYSPIPPSSLFFFESPNYGISDIEIAKSLLVEIERDKLPTFEITTFEEYNDVAKIVQREWEKIGIKTKIKTVYSVPDNFQIFLFRFKPPNDPDQYILWHSNQVNNISGYKSIRIDKLLEDGRLVSDINKRKIIYAEFQKYLIDDVPASFLYFPYEYTIIRR